MESKEAEKKVVPRAKKFYNLIKKGRNGLVKFQAYRKSPSFKRPTKNLLRIPRNPKYQRKVVQRVNTWDRYSILLGPCTSERFYKKMENENTIILFVSQKANKQEIKKAFKEAFGTNPIKVNTMNTVLGRKKAFIKLPKTTEASEIANKMGML